MSYIFKGRLCGYICKECQEPLSNVKVRLYRSRKDQDVASLAVAEPKETFAILSDDTVKAKQSSLIAEAETADDGSFTFELGDKQKYNGEAFEVDVYCGTVPRRKPGPNPPPPVQFSITTLQPRWRPSERDFVAAWEYCLPYRYWCPVRLRFGAWVICGIVTDCKQHAPIAGVKVRAFDVDWLQDDELGSGITDATGHFRIDYLTQDFTRTPFSPVINFEWVSGPDLYFKVETGTTVLLNEPRSRGRAPDRENVGNCFCVDLCIEGTLPPVTSTIPIFRKVGIYNVDPGDPDFAALGFNADGEASPGNYGFTGTVKLRGALPNGNAPDALEYHFRVGEYDAAGAVLGPVSNVEANKIGATVIGALEYWDWDAVLSVWHHRVTDWYANNPGVSPVTVHTPGGPLIVDRNVNVDPGGWIKVPRLNEFFFGGRGWFVGGSEVNLIELKTTELTNEFFDLIAPPPVVEAGDHVPAPKKSRKHRFRLFFESRIVAGAVVSSNDREKIAFSNTSFKQRRHPNWPESSPDPTLLGVVSLNIGELGGPGGGCQHLHNELHALYTAYHPFAGSASVYFEGPPALPAAIALAFAADGEAVSPAGGHLFDISGLQPCAYILWLQVNFNLTNGWTFFGATLWDHLAFCKV
jgi:hypothetical protein